MASAKSSLLGLYPSRPRETLAATPPVEALREILARAPELPEHLHAEGVVNGIYASTDWATGNSHHEWCDEYLADLYKALIEVIKSHGIEGWKIIRWEVYDKVRPSRMHLKFRFINTA